jgi:HD superfamily phosphohydrolase
MAKKTTVEKQTAPVSRSLLPEISEHTTATGALDENQELPGQELFLPIHGHVELYADEIAIIDHPAFQRLRRVRQLGMAHMVFPGATHTRFEHSIGAVYVAQLIIDHVNKNHSWSKKRNGQFRLQQIDQASGRFIRLAALLHDVGHLPFGHTLEDELNHLRSHDGPERLERVAKIAYAEHQVDQSIVLPGERPPSGWSLEALVDRLYKRHVNALGINDVGAFALVSHIICKPPKEPGPLKIAWAEQAKSLGARMMLRVCRDVVGNTICADFLDYLHRDWYHLGKPLYYDKRLYQYMEVLQPVESADGGPESRFVINVGAGDKIRHDALTDMLSLLNARYKLAQTVLFHRTKLALTGLLDRCLLEISDLYQQVGFASNKFMADAEELLLNASDDGLPMILEHLAQGGNSDGRKVLSQALEKEKTAILEHTDQRSQVPLMESKDSARFDGVSDHMDSAAEPVIRGKLGAQKELALRLINKLRDREVYSLVYKLRISDFTGPHKPDNPRLLRLLNIYKDPPKRLEFLRGIEALCNLQSGSMVMNCPSDAAMNAKIAKVSLFVEGEITQFDTYELSQGESSLTRGALWAQISRFYELLAASVYLDRKKWDALSEDQRQHLRSLVKTFFFQMGADDPKIVRMQMQPSLEVFVSRASQHGTTDPRSETFRGFIFPSGVPFDSD